MWNYGKESRGHPFRKGNRPWNTKPVGAERLTGSGFIQIKVAQPDHWKLKHLLVWEKVHGPLPENCAIEFIDGDRQNFRLENLRLRSTRSRTGDERLGPKGFIEVKVSARRWRLKHIVIWEEAHGPLPKTHVLYFADGDKFNFALVNLVPFPKSGRLGELAGLLPGRGLDTLGLSRGLAVGLKRQAAHRAAGEALRIRDDISFAQLEYLSLTNGDPNVFYRQ